MLYDDDFLSFLINLIDQSGYNSPVRLKLDCSSEIVDLIEQLSSRCEGLIKLNE